MTTIIPSLQDGRAVLSLIQRDLRLAFRNPGQTLNPVAFYCMVTSLFPLGIGPEHEVLAALAGKILWIGACLAILLSLNSLFRSDEEDGSLDQLLLSPHPLPLLVLAKIFAHWLTTGVAIIVIAPVLALTLQVPTQVYPALIASLILGIPLMSLTGCISAALTVKIQKGGILLYLLTLPFYIPVLIFGTGAVQTAIDGLPYFVHLLWLAALLILELCLAPIIIAVSLRIVTDE